MNNAFSRMLQLLAAPALISALSSCVDTSPIDYHAPPTPDAGPADAASTMDGALAAECRSCVTDQCKTQYDSCTTNPTCTIFTDCMIDTYCLNLSNNLANLPPCVAACGDKAKLKSSEDPASTAFALVLFCAQDHCSDPCGI